MDRSNADERQRVLAARGWESDRDRTRVLRGLLADHTQRIYLWSYHRLRNKDRAVELTRESLLWVSRTLNQIPEDRALDHWVFEHMATETPAKLEWRRSELGPEPTLVLGANPNTHYLESYPTTKVFLDAHNQYHNNIEDAALIKRSGWEQVRTDLEHFLDGHFGEEAPEEGEEASPLRHRLSRKKMGFKQYFQLALLAGALYFVANLYSENLALKEDVARLQAALNEPSPENPTSALDQIESARMEVHDSNLRFVWRAVPGVTEYRVAMYNSKMEPLWLRENIESAATSVLQDEIQGFDPAGSYLFRVEGIEGSDVVASSGFVPYPPI